MNHPERYEEDFIDLRQYAVVLWRWKWVLVLGAFLAALAAFGTSKLKTPVYEASTTLLINEAPDSQTSDYTALLMSERLARTYSEMLSQRPVLATVIEELDLPEEVDELQGAITVQPVRDTQLIELSVEHASATRAAAIANAIVAEFQDQTATLQQSRFAESKASLEGQLERLDGQIAETEAAIAELGDPEGAQETTRLERLQADLAQYQASYSTLLQSYEELRVAEAQSSSNVIQVEPAEPDFDPVRPRTLMNTALAGVVGGMLALGAVFLIEYLDDTVKSPDQVERALGLPVIGAIAEMPEPEPGMPYVASQPRAPVAEAFRSLRSNIQFAAVDEPVKTLLITSPGPEQGKSTVAVNLGAVLAQGGRQVILLEADLRRPKVDKLLGLGNGIGLSDLFVQDPLAVESALKDTGVEGLRAVPSGELPPNPAELLGSARMSRILEALTERCDMVVVDTAPAAVVTDPVVLSAKVDGVLLVVEPGATKLEAAVQAVESLRRAGARILGAVFNNIPLKGRGYYGGGAYRYYQYEYAYSVDGRGKDEKEKQEKKERQEKKEIKEKKEGKG